VPDTPSITLIKMFDYRGVNEEWSNTYHFSGTTPADAAAWKTLADALFTEEKKVWSNQTVGVRAYGYEAGTEHAVAVIDYQAAPLAVIVGTFTATGLAQAPGDCAATVRWWTGAYSSRGKKVYCRKYFHDVYIAGGSNNDVVASAQVTAYNTLAAKLIDGTLPGSFKYCGPQGAVLSAPAASTFVTTRTLKRRGKRPPT
jgi:hypothetical protein